MSVSMVNKDKSLVTICENLIMLNLQKIRKMAYNQSEKNQESQKSSTLLEDGHAANVGDGKCLKVAVCIYRVVIFKREDG